ncbi:MAG: DNA polymerase III subunit gamma/tau [Lysobacterales bacterium]
MSYQVLARKWRPQRFAELVGQEHVVQALVNGLTTGRLHHAFLFTGTRGVGKTTIARILAKSLNCERGISADPCGECSACVDIAAGRFVDLLEIDAASRTGVDDTRELLDNVPYAPARGRCKVYLIDEVHMLSTASFNALLKTLEEPPEHVRFLLATTDPQKLPVTVLSRCLQFSLRRLTRAEISAQLTRILQAEGVEFDVDAVDETARHADGSMRDALSLLDQALAYGAGALRGAEVRQMLGTVGRGLVAELYDAILAADDSVLRERLAALQAQAPNYKRVLQDLLELSHDVAARQVLGDEVESSLVDAQQLSRWAAQVAPEQLQLHYQFLLQGLRDLHLAPEGRIAFSMAILRLLAFQPPSAGSSSSGSGVSGGVQAPSLSAARATSVPSSAASVSAPVSSGNGSSSPGDGGSVWQQLLQSESLRGPPRSLAQHLEPRQLSGTRWQFALAEGYDYLLTDFARAELGRLLGELAGHEVRIEIGAGGSAQATHAAVVAEQRERERGQREQDLTRDATVQALQDTFGARRVEDEL